MKRIVLFLVTNIAVMLVLSIAASVLGVNRFLHRQRPQPRHAAGFAAIMGFGGSFISLMMSKMMAKWSTGARIIDARRTRPSSGWSRPCASRPKGRHRHAGSGHLRRRAECLRHRAEQEQLAGRGVHRPVAGHEQGGSRGRAGARSQPRRQRRHGDADADPGRGEHFRHLPFAHRRLPGRQLPAQGRFRVLRPWHRLHRSPWSSATSCSASSPASSSPGSRASASSAPMPAPPA
jgi:hypothetical protein